MVIESSYMLALFKTSARRLAFSDLPRQEQNSTHLRVETKLKPQPKTPQTLNPQPLRLTFAVRSSWEIASNCCWPLTASTLLLGLRGLGIRV